MMNVGRATLTAASALLLFSACSEDQPVAPAAKSGLPSTRNIVIAALSCTADRVQLVVACNPPSFVGQNGKFTPRTDLILGGQGTFVKLTTTNATYNAGTTEFRFDMTVQNLIEQPIGTLDGVSLDPGGVQVFFSSGPTVTSGSGLIEVVPDGTATFTAPSQPFYRYSQVLDQNEVSGAKGWLMKMPGTVTTFAFTLLVAAEVQYPDGYIVLTVDPAPLAPGATRQVTAVVKNANGTVDAGATVAWSQSDANVATVNGSGLVTGVRGGTVAITAMENGGSRLGSTNLTVTGTIRTWTGAVSSDWSVNGNWSASPNMIVPGPVDTVVVPVVATFPALTSSVTVGRVAVADGATLSIGAFDLTATVGVVTGPTVGSGVLGTTGRVILSGNTIFLGRLPLTLITGGTATVLNTSTHTAPIAIDAGELKIESILVDISAQ